MSAAVRDEVLESAIEPETITPLTARTAIVPTFIGVVLAVASAAITLSVGLPAWTSCLMALAGAGLGFLAILDARSLLIANRHTLVFFLVSVAGLGASAMVVGDWVLLAFGLGSGALGFVLLFICAVVDPAAVGGGDIKLVGIPAMLLGAFNPMLAIIWLLFTCIPWLLTAVVVMVRKRAGWMDPDAKAPIPMAVLMAVALTPAIAVAGNYLSSLGLT